MRKSLIIYFSLFIIIIAGFKTFLFNNPPNSPEEVVRTFIDAFKDGKSSKESDLFISDEEKIEIFGKTKEEWGKIEKEIRKELEEMKYPLTVYEIYQRSSEGEKREITAEIGEPTPLMFWDFTLVKEGNWFRGYKWKIMKIESSDMEELIAIKEIFGEVNEGLWYAFRGKNLKNTAKIGTEVDLEGVTIKISKPEEWTGDSLYKPKKFNKFVTFEVELENKSKEIKSYHGDFTLVDSYGNSYHSVTGGRKPSIDAFLPSSHLPPSAKERGYVTFEIPKNSRPIAILYEGDIGEAIFKIEKSL